MAEKMNIGDAIPSLRQSLHEEEKMFGWLRANAPAMFAKLWPEIVSPSTDSVASSTIKTSKESVAEIHQTFKCESCNGSFNSREDLRQHTIHKHEK
jgi:transposase-like protein